MGGLLSGIGGPQSGIGSQSNAEGAFAAQGLA